jgi:predicted RNase H-like HicB family nuclease
MKGKKIVYPVVLNPAEEGGYNVYVPDFDGHTQGDDLAEALFMAQDAIEMMGVFLQDEKRPVPSPSDVKKIKAGKDGIVTLVTVDFEEYRRKNEKKVVRKSVTIPSWLNVEAEKAGINFSAALQAVLKEQLGVKT